MDGGPLCLNCAEFGDLIFLESGDPTLTRRVRKHSDRVIIVVKFSRARKRHERQGLLIMEATLQKAKNEISEECS